jgi:hypothetical protein
MKHLSLVLLLCAAAGLAAPGAAMAFEIQGAKPDHQDAASMFAKPLQQQFVVPDFKGHSLAMPYSSQAADSPFVGDYGNAIAIPGPGIDRPAPAWALSPSFRH